MARGGDGKIQVLSTAAYKRLKDEARERGRKEALEELAKQNGYASVDAMLTSLKPRQQPPSNVRDDEEEELPKQPKQPDDRQEPKSVRAMARDRDRLQRELDQLKRRYESESSRRKELQTAIDATEAEMELRVMATRAGVHDVDYAITLLTRTLEGKSEAELDAFDGQKFFDGLHTTHPYLFKEVSVPATTGTGVGNAPSALKPGEAAQTVARNSQTDARKMSADEYRKYLAAKGLQINV
jgi:hypothetical protein